MPLIKWRRFVLETRCALMSPPPNTRWCRPGLPSAFSAFSVRWEVDSSAAFSARTSPGGTAWCSAMDPVDAPQGIGPMNIFFDLDDTIHDKSTSLEKCGNALFYDFLATSEIEQAQFVASFLRENCIVQPKVKVFQNLAVEFGISNSTEQVMQSVFDSTFHNYAQRFDFVAETFEFLRNLGIKIGCITNGRDFFQRNKISALGLEEYFDVIVTSGELGIKKPDHRIFMKGLAALNALPCESVFVGDNLNADMIPAKELGMVTIWKSDRQTEPPKYVDHQLSTFADFQKIWGQIALTVG